MQKTAQQPVGSGWTPEPPPIANRQESSYHETQERSWIDKAVLFVVGILAITVIALSFGNTGALAETLNLNPWLAAGLVEMLFGTLLFIRARQRALQRNVPRFLDVGYFSSLTFVTAVNMHGLGQIHSTGWVVGAAITGAMWLMENTLVWLWTDSERPHEKTAKELEREAEKKIERIKRMKRIQWRWKEAEKPDLDLIKEARKAEQQREKVVGDGLPEFFSSSVPVEPNGVLVESDVQTVTGQTVEQDARTVIEEQKQEEKTSEGRNETEEPTTQPEQVDKVKASTKDAEEEAPTSEKKERREKKKTPANLSEKRKKTEKEKKRVRKEALRIWAKEKTRPGRDKIRNKTGCTDHVAKGVVADLKMMEKGVTTTVAS